MEQKDIYDTINDYFKNYPYLYGILVIAIGVFMLAAAFFNWNWIFQGHSWNLQKIEGIANFFGRGVARLLFAVGGIACIAIGIFVILVVQK